MKNLVFLLALILSYTFSFSQDNLKLIVKKDKANDIVEKYYVMKNDKKIKHGEYEKFMNENLIQKGQYSNNKKIGVWKFYDSKKKLELKYSFDDNEVILNKQTEPNDTLDRPVIFLGSTYEARRLIQLNLKYPKDALVNGKSGRIIISILIDETGKIYDYKVKQKVYPALDEEAARVVKLVSGEWLPAIYKGNKIKFSYEFPVVFQLADY